MKEFTCIVCPRGCQLNIDDQLNVSGNFCPRGKEYALNEITNPRRNISSTMKVINRMMGLLPVKTSKPIPKALIFKVMEVINSTGVNAPIKIGDIVVKNVLDTGVDILACKNID